jgi:hypothetical protein
MDIIAAYREAGTFRGAAEIAGTTHKTVKRVIARHEAGGAAPGRVPRGHNYDGVTVLPAATAGAHARSEHTYGDPTGRRCCTFLLYCLFDLFELGLLPVELWGFEPQTSCMPSSGNPSTGVRSRRSPVRGSAHRSVCVPACCGTFLLYEPMPPRP